MRYSDFLHAACIKHGREPLFIAFLLEDVPGTACAELNGSEQEVDEKCICHSLQKIIEFFTSDKPPRHNYDAQDAAIELEAMARYVADKRGEDPRYQRTYELFTQLPAVYWNDNGTCNDLLRQILATFSSVSNGHGG